MSVVRRIRAGLRTLHRCRVWRPGHARVLGSQVTRWLHGTNGGSRHDDARHLAATAGWLAAAQDATGDGGVAGRYSLERGWTSSYPETTGYLVPTFLALARALRAPRFEDRAARGVEFLLRVQLHGGGYPGGEIAENRTEASAFNTAQVLCGLEAWYGATGDPRTRDAAARAADWLVRVQQPDGTWRDPFAHRPAAYSAFAAAWLARFGRTVGEPRYLDAAGRKLDWVMRRWDPTTGWFEDAGFPDEHARRTASTHTLGYTLAGTLLLAELLDRADAAEAVRTAATEVAALVARCGWLPGIIDHAWRPAAGFGCLTGNAQLALVWFVLCRRDGDVRWLQAAARALACVKVSQALRSPNPGILGGVPGSAPIWGAYLPLAFPNWAAKFYADALIAHATIREPFEP